jgi:hypothetical protein
LLVGRYRQTKKLATVNIGPVMAFFGAKRSVLAGTWCVNNV